MSGRQGKDYSPRCAPAMLGIALGERLLKDASEEAERNCDTIFKNLLAIMQRCRGQDEETDQLLDQLIKQYQYLDRFQQRINNVGGLLQSVRECDGLPSNVPSYTTCRERQIDEEFRRGIISSEGVP